MAIAHLNSDLSLILTGVLKTLLLSMPPKLNFYTLPLDMIFLMAILFYSTTKLNTSSSLNILGVSFSRDLSWKDHIYSLTKSATMKLGMLYCLKKILYPRSIAVSV